MLRTLSKVWNQFLFAPCDLKAVAAFRVSVAGLMLINLIVLGLDLHIFYGPSSVMPLEVSRGVIDSSSHSFFEWMPDTIYIIWACYGLAIISVSGLLLGFYPKILAFLAFFFTTNLQHRNLLLFDGEDQLFRLFLFFLIFLPSHYFFTIYTYGKTSLNRHSETQQFGCAWAMRLVQIQMTLVYVGAAFAKIQSPEWQSGFAIWYVSRLNDSFGNFSIPSFLLDSILSLKLINWTTMIMEIILPIGLWIPKYRLSFVFAAIAFHLAILYSMNLFLFQPLMIVGCCHSILTVQLLRSNC